MEELRAFTSLVSRILPCRRCCKFCNSHVAMKVYMAVVVMKP